MTHLAVVGAGMAGLAAVGALAPLLPRLTVLEAAPAFGEVGAGVQLGPNATRLLRDWGLLDEAMTRGVQPTHLVARDLRDGRTLGRLELGDAMTARYGAPYLTLHRADLHGLLLRRALAHPNVTWHMGDALQTVAADGEGWALSSPTQSWRADAVLGCDGVRSAVRAQVWRDGAAPFTGHVAYRALVPMADWPVALRAPVVTVWLGDKMHAVHYPVQGGRAMNVVWVVQGDCPTEPAGWAHDGVPDTVKAALRRAGAQAADWWAVAHAVPAWTWWPLFDRSPMTSAAEHARGSVALLGDAAHPLRPYLAQGAAMALEDVAALQTHLQRHLNGHRSVHWPALLADWAAERWPRNAWVQARSRRNGRLFHAHGPLRWGRDWAMRWGGDRVMDVPALYGYTPGR